MIINCNNDQTSNEELSEQARRLGHAAADGDTDGVRAILRAYPGVVRARGGLLGSTPLHLAADRGLCEIAELLLGAGADVNAREGASGTTPLHWAAANGCTEMIRLLVDHGADLNVRDGWHDLGPAAWAAIVPDSPHLQAVEYLLFQGAEMDLFTAVALQRIEDLRAAVQADPSSIRRTMNLLEDARGPLHAAVLKRLPQMVDALLASGADIGGRTAWGLTPLCLALRAQDDEMAHYLRDRGAPEDVSSLLQLGCLEQAAAVLDEEPLLVRPGGPCHLLLHFAARDGLADAAALLLSRGADADSRAPEVIDEVCCQVTPLHRAALYGRTGAMQALLEGGTDPNARTHGHWDVTALHAAAWRGHADVARMLLSFGADPSLRDTRTGGSALDWAAAWGNEAVASVLAGGG